MSCRRPLPSWSRPPQHAWQLEEIKHGNIISSHPLNDVIQNNNSSSSCCITFGRIADDPSVVDIVTAHESCSRLHARIAFDQNGTPWLRDLGSGNGTFVNERRLPPEACGRGEEPNGNRKGSRGVVLYPGDAIRFGASTRIFMLEGPEEFERGAIKLKRKMKEAAAAAGLEPENQSNEEAPPKANEDGCGWGMADDIAATEQEQQAQANDHSNNHSNLPSIESFFYSPKYSCNISDALLKLHGQYNTKMHKLQSIQTESARITQKENMGVELTDGQRGQLAKNQERLIALEKESVNLKKRIEDGMYTAIHGKERANKRPKEENQYHDDDDVDDFFDRTASSSKRQRKETNDAESEPSLIQKWKSNVGEHARQQRMVTRALERCMALQIQIDNSKEDDEDAFFLQNDLTLANDNLSKAKRSLEETEKELDETEYLLKIVNTNLVWDRKERLIGTNIEKREAVSNIPRTRVNSEIQKNGAIDSMETGPIMMPPPPPVITASSMPPPPPIAAASSSMPPPPSPMPTSPSMAVASPSKPTLPEPPRRLGPQKTLNVAEPLIQKKKTQLGPRRPPVNVQGTLAALKQAGSQPTQAPASHPVSQSSGKKRAPMVSNPSDPQKDEWKAPVDQDGSGRTALHDKFKGRY
ncbi:hypothetical protein ACHAXR_007957 [Thalassiosira sp. AJA248-18]